VRPGDVVHTTITYGAPHHLVADGPLLSHRRTRAGDRHNEPVISGPVTSRPVGSGPAPAGLGLPGFGPPAEPLAAQAASVAPGCAR
jgi:tRNA-2-methylthio-N6-dimethylallyladenosine synthase